MVQMSQDSMVQLHLLAAPKVRRLHNPPAYLVARLLLPSTSAAPAPSCHQCVCLQALLETNLPALELMLLLRRRLRAALELMVQKVGPLLRADGYGDGPPPVSTISFGVYHNTIYGNRSRGNGLASKNGAGVAIYATVTGASAYGNVVVANLLMENALPGVTLHATGSGQNLNDNLIAGNTVVNNGADTQDAATSAATGISVYSTVPATGTMVVGNAVQQEALDVAVQSPSV